MTRDELKQRLALLHHFEYLEKEARDKAKREPSNHWKAYQNGLANGYAVAVSNLGRLGGQS